MTDVARNHHVVPQGYLVSFTDTGTRVGRLCVFDLSTGKGFPAKPRNVAAIRDFNRVNTEGQRPDALERALGRFEGEAIGAIRMTCACGSLPTENALDLVLNLIALLVVRNPVLRRSHNHSRAHEVRIIEGLLASDRRLYESHLRRARRHGFVTGPDIPFEQYVEAVERDDCDWEVSTDESLATELGIFESTLQLLGRRRWSLLVAGLGAPDFITCDQPVTLAFKDARRSGPIGVGLAKTEVAFPLSPRHALFGVFEDPLPPCVVADSESVAIINHRTFWHANRQVFSRAWKVRTLVSGQDVELDLRSMKALKPSAR